MLNHNRQRKNKVSAISCVVYVVCRMALDKQRLKKFLDMFGGKLRDYRKLSGLSVAELAKAADMDRSTVNNIENGDQNWPLGTYMELVEACDVPFEVVIEGFRGDSVPEHQQQSFENLRLLYGTEYSHLRESVLTHLGLAAREVGKLKRDQQKPKDEGLPRPDSREGGGTGGARIVSIKRKKRKRKDEPA